MSHASPFDFAIQDVGDLAPVSLEGTEAVSTPFAFSVVVRAASDSAAAFESHIDRDASLAFVASSGARRTLTGVIRRVEIIERTASGELVIRYGFAPRYARLDERYWSRIHPNLSVPAAIARVLDEHGVPHRFELSGQYPEREYQVQYQETDRAFVERIAAEVGLFFYFAASTEGRATTLVFADGNSRLRAVDAPSELQVHEFEGSATARPALREEQVASFQVAHVVAPRAVVGFDYDFKRPLHGLREQASPDPFAQAVAGLVGAEFPVRPGTVYEHRSDTERPELTGPRAAAVLDQWRHDAQVGSCVAGSRVLAPGYRFTLARHAVDGLSRGYVITSVKHIAHAEEAAGRASYQAELTCVVDSVVPRPPRPPRRVVQVAESAVVVGPEGHDIHTDEHGRVRIRFHWDTRGSVELASCFVRVVQPWSGEGWGMQFIPRIGMEVLVTFLQGDPDVPIVMGALPNATHPPPFPLPEQRSRSGIKTRSTPHGTGHNELSFEDAAGGERILMHAQRDLRTEVNRDRQTVIAGNDSLDLTGSQQEHVNGFRRTTVEEQWEARARGGFAAEVDGPLQVKAEGDASLRCRRDLDVQATGAISLDSNTILRASAWKALRLSVAAPDHFGELALASEGSVNLSATREVLVTAPEGITLVCGTTRVELRKDRIQIVADEIELSARKSFQAAGHGPALKLGDEAEIVAKKLSLYSEHAALELSRNARLSGEAISLERPPTREAPESKATDEPTKALDLTFLDEHRQPYEKATYFLRAGGERYQGNLNMDGRLRARVPARAETAEVTLWIDTYPEGRRKHYTFAIGDFAPTNEPRGAKQRLKMLGFFQGDMNDTFDPELAAALRHFQHVHGLEPTGLLDSATLDEIERAFGH